MQRRKHLLLVLASVLLALTACGPPGAAGRLREDGGAFSPALATWDYATATGTPRSTLSPEDVASTATGTRIGDADSSESPGVGDGTVASPTPAPYPEPWWTATPVAAVELSPTAGRELQATTEVFAATNTAVAATVAAGGGTPTPDLTRWAEETQAAPSPTITATPTPYCRLQEVEPVSASLQARLQAAAAAADIPGLYGNQVAALDRICDGQEEGEATPGGSTWFYVGISTPDHDVEQVLDSFAAYLEMLMVTFGPDDLYGEEGLIYGSLATSSTGAAGEPLRWHRSVGLDAAEVRALYGQGLRGRELTNALGYVE